MNTDIVAKPEVDALCGISGQKYCSSELVPSLTLIDERIPGSKLRCAANILRINAGALISRLD